MSIRPWHVEASTYLHKDRWLTLRADDCRTPGGVAVAPYYVFEYPDWAHAVVFNAERHILIVRQYRHGAGGVCVELPGGIVDPEDTSPLQAVQREVREETGCTAPRWEALTTLHPNPATHTNLLHVFAAFSALQTAAPAPDTTEEFTHAFLPVGEVLKMIESGAFCQAQQVGSIFLALRHAGWLSLAVL